MKSDKALLDFLSSFGKQGKLALILLLGLGLILIGSLSLGGGDKATGEEERVAEMCSLIEGVGECRVMMTYRDEGEVFAVLVLCEGAESARVREDLTSLICSLYGIGSHRVEIFLLN
nr:hypothetical protein [Oscillospiraceae bacterium]